MDTEGHTQRDKGEREREKTKNKRQRYHKKKTFLHRRRHHHHRHRLRRTAAESASFCSFLLSRQIQSCVRCALSQNPRSVYKSPRLNSNYHYFFNYFFVGSNFNLLFFFSFFGFVEFCFVYEIEFSVLEWNDSVCLGEVGTLIKDWNFLSLMIWDWIEAWNFVCLLLWIFSFLGYGKFEFWTTKSECQVLLL